MRYIRIASNSMLETPEQKSLSDAFKFSETELEKITGLNLDSEVVYTKQTIASNLNNACFSATALTDDEVTGLKGYSKRDNIISMQTIFSGYKGYTIKLKTYHKCLNSIDYSACFSQMIDDLSIVLPIKDLAVKEHLERFILELENTKVKNKLLFTSISDLHITLYELGIHYGGFSSVEDINYAKIEALKAIDSVDKEISCCIFKPALTENSIIYKVKVSEELIKQFNNMGLLLNGKFFNVKRVPYELHITIAQFKEYLYQDDIEVLKNIVDKYTKLFTKSITFYGNPTLIHITSTPYIFKPVYCSPLTKG